MPYFIHFDSDIPSSCHWYISRVLLLLPQDMRYYRTTCSYAAIRGHSISFLIFLIDPFHFVCIVKFVSGTTFVIADSIPVIFSSSYLFVVTDSFLLCYSSSSEWIFVNILWKSIYSVSGLQKCWITWTLYVSTGCSYYKNTLTASNLPITDKILNVFERLFYKFPNASSQIMLIYLFPRKSQAKILASIEGID